MCCRGASSKPKNTISVVNHRNVPNIIVLLDPPSLLDIVTVLVKTSRTAWVPTPLKPIIYQI